MTEYFQAINNIPRMNEEDNRRLIALAQTGDIQARNDVILGNTSLVIFIAKRYSKRAPLDELIAEGNLGLFTAVRKFDLSKEVKFGTYAYWWIRNHITRMLAEPPYRGVIHVPQSMWNKIVKNKEEELSGADRRVYNTAIAALKTVEREWDCVDKNAEEPHDTLHKEDRYIYVSELLRRANISERQKYILEAFAYRNATLADLASELQISRERVRVLKAQALEKLRKFNE